MLGLKREGPIMQVWLAFSSGIFLGVFIGVFLLGLIALLPKFKPIMPKQRKRDGKPVFEGNASLTVNR